MGNASGMLGEAAGRAGERPAIVDAGSGAATTFGGLQEQAMRIAARLSRAGLEPGDRVAVLLDRGPRAAAAYFGVLASGGVAILVNETLKARQIDYILRHSGAFALLTDGRLLRRAAAGAAFDVPVIDFDDAIEGTDPAEAMAPRVGADMAHIIYTSGSTGLPKGVVISHANVWAGVDAVVEYVAVTAEDRIASLLPFSFDYGLNQLLCCVRAGATLVVERSPVPQRIVQVLYDRSVTVLPAVPPLWLQLLTVERFSREPSPSLRAMTNSGGRLPREAVRKLRRSQPQADLYLMYGLTEAFRSAFLDPGKVDGKPDSIGRAIPGAELMVVRDDHTPCGPDEVGELVHRGPTVALGYWNDPDATAARFRPNPSRPAGTPDAERVVFSGDLVRMDEEGDLYFVARRDAMIKSLGYRISPDEVSDALYSSGEVTEVAIASEADAVRGDAIVAYVVLAHEGDVGRLKAYAARELPRYMQPVRYEVRDALARTSSGKHDVRAVADAAA